jgi:hypothetical protein
MDRSKFCSKTIHRTGSQMFLTILCKAKKQGSYYALLIQKKWQKNVNPRF